MGTLTLSHQTARWLALTSFGVNFAAQLYGMLSHPNLQEIHDANLSFFSPHPYFIGAFFLFQQVLQIGWLYRLCRPRKDESGSSTTLDVENVEDTMTMVDYVPFYALGSFCIAAWMISWTNSSLRLSNFFVTVNTLAQLFYILSPTSAAVTAPMNLESSASILTHAVAKTFAGIGVIDLLHNSSVAFFNHRTHPGPLGMLFTGVGFGALACCSDWIFGGCLVYDLVALGVGQRVYHNAGWSNLLFLYAGGTAALVALKNLVVKPQPYSSRRTEGYEPLK